MNPPIEHMMFWVQRYIRDRKGVTVRIAFPKDHWNHYLLREAYAIAANEYGVTMTSPTSYTYFTR